MKFYIYEDYLKKTSRYKTSHRDITYDMNKGHNTGVNFCKETDDYQTFHGDFIICASIN